MLTERSDSVPLEIAHVLFMDIVGYTKLPVDHQRRVNVPKPGREYLFYF